MKKIILPLILLIGFLFRLYHNTSVALWHDEAFSALYIKYSWGEMMHRIVLDVHPPLYYLILRLYHYIFGSSLFSLRLLSIIFGLLTIYAGYLFVKKAFKNENWALAAALALALNPFQIQYALEARMYTLGTFLALLSSYFLVKALETGNKKDWIWYSILVAANLYTHYYLIFTVAAQGLYLIYVLIKDHWRQTKAAASSIVLAFILYLPWVPTLLKQISRVEESYWIPQMDRWSISNTIWKIIFGGESPSHMLVIIATLIALALLVYFVRLTKQREKWLVVLGLLFPFIASVLFSLKTALYLDRYFVFASCFFSILIILALVQLKNYTTRRTLVALFLIVSVVWFFNNWKKLPQGPGMAAASEYLNDRAGKDNKIYVGSSFVYFTFKYYNQTGIKPLLYSSGPLETIPHFSGTAILTNDDLVLDFKPTPKGSHIWLIWTTGFGQNKPNIPGNWNLVEEKSFVDTPAFKGEIFVDQYRVN